MDTNRSENSNTISREDWDEAEKRYYENRAEKIGRRVSVLSQIGPRQIKNDPTGAASLLFSDRLITPKVDYQSEKGTTIEDRLDEEIGKFSRNIFFEVGTRGEELQRTMTEYRAFLKLALELKNGENNVDAARFQAVINEAQIEYDAIGEENPEGYSYKKGKELRAYYGQIENGRVALTPSVEENVYEVVDRIEDGLATFLSGPTGSGKTAGAIEAAVIAGIERAALDEAKKEVGNLPPGTSKEEAWHHLGTEYRKRIREYSRKYNQHELEVYERFSPEFISCARDTSRRDLFAKDTLELATPNNISALEQYEAVEADVKEWIRKHPKDAEDEDKLNRVREGILQSYLSKNSQSGTVIKTIIGPVAKAIQEGKTVILDEVNHAPTEVMSSLHQILTAKPGDEIKLPGIDNPVVVQPGFAVIMTGNESSEITDYLGTNEFNLATKNRFKEIEYGYPLMSEKEASKENELYQIVIAKLLDKEGNLTLPDIERTMGKLFNLCILAKRTQRIFEGKWFENQIFDDRKVPHDIKLSDPPMTVRNLIAILDNWNKGLKKDLDQAIWDEFITQYKGADQSLIIQLAKDLDFFSANDGWDFSKFTWGTKLTINDVRPNRTRFVNTKTLSMDTITLPEVVRKLFGEGPRRDVYPAVSFDDLARLERGQEDDTFGPEQSAEVDEKMEEMKKAIEALKVLYNQCGCNISS